MICGLLEDSKLVVPLRPIDLLLAPFTNGIWISVGGIPKKVVNWHIGNSSNVPKAVLFGHRGNASNQPKEFYPSISIPNNLIGLFSSAPGTGWDLLNGSGSYPDLNGLFLKGASSQGSSTGANTHGHGAYTGNSGTANRGTRNGTASFTTSTQNYNHTHSIAHTHANDDHRPEFYELLPYVVNGASEIPTSFIGFCSGAVFTDWSAVAALYDKFISCNTSAAGGTGGAASHAHSWTGNTGSGSGSSETTTAGSGTSASGAHTHDLSHGHTTSNLPPYIDLIPVSPDAAASALPSGLICFFLGGTAPDGWTTYSAAQNKFIRAKSSVDETGGGNSTHTHAASMNTGGWGDARAQSTTDSTSAQTSHIHSANHTHSTAGTLEPEHIPLLICKKD